MKKGRAKQQPAVERKQMRDAGIWGLYCTPKERKGHLGGTGDVGVRR